ncbi:MAG: diheme cytochrome c-553 [Ferruginibacter sp.]
MKKISTVIIVGFVSAIFIFSRCSENKSNETGDRKDSSLVSGAGMGGFETRVKWGEHLVTIAGCNDCHTPKKMTPTGPEPDFSLTLSGHPAKIPPPDVDRKAMESKGLAVTNDLTVWIGPWGVSYTANITSDSTGIGNWTEAQFLLCMKEGKWKGIAGNRELLPPMPWKSSFRFMSDDELKAIFAYLKSTKPINNVEPPIEPPVSAGKK